MTSRLAPTHTPLATPAALEQRQSLLQAILFYLVAGVALLGHFWLGANFGGAGYIWIVLIACLSLFISIELAYAMLLGSVFLQNAFICLVTPNIDDVQHYSVLLGSSFVLVVLCSMIGIPAWFKFHKSLPKENMGLLKWLAFFVVIVVIYSLYGMISTAPMSVILYTRMYLTGALLLVAGIAMGFQISPAYATNVVRLLAITCGIWALAEYFLTYDLYSFFNIVEFLNFKFANRADPMVFTTVSDAIDYDNHAYLNLSGSLGLDINIPRLKGTTIHSISFSYALVFCTLVCFMRRARFLTITSFILVMLIGAKGPMIMTLMSLILYGIYRYTQKNLRLTRLAMVCAMLIYLTGGILYGLHTKDYHIVGFIGGIKGFISNPLGHGVGVGGTLSANMQGSGDTENMMMVFQNLGANFAFESGFGVMLYQLGIGTFVFLMFYYRFWKILWNAAQASEEPRLFVLPFVIAFLLVNSVFQEEAFSPVCWGLWLFYGGMIITRYGRKLQAEAPPAPLQPPRRTALSQKRIPS
jgi:hypothetical protein